MAKLPSPFNLTLLHKKLDEDYKNLIAQERTTLELPPVKRYKIQDTFLEEDQYWIGNVWGERFDRTLEIEVLFRPAVVNELVWMVETCLAEDGGPGLMIKGPQGIGKSHSIVNLVRQLLYHSDCKYFVTFIPNCAIWTGVLVLFEFICKSFGSNPDELGIEVTGNTVRDEDLLQKLVAAIDAKLATQGRQWVFVFDQINKLFARFPKIKDITNLPFPFNYMFAIMKPGRITTIISASTNNELLYRENHSGFLDYDHCHSFTRHELKRTFPTLNSLDKDAIESMMDATGGVPLQVQERLKWHENGVETLECPKKKVKVLKNFKDYENGVNFSVKVCLNALQNQLQTANFEEVTKNTCRCLLHLPLKGLPQYYDRKYSVLSKDVLSEDWYLKPLFPLIFGAYRNYFWDKLMEYVKRIEEKHLAICNEVTTTKDTLGRIFEHLVILRCLHGNLALCTTSEGIAKHEFPGLEQCQLVERFLGQTLPKGLIQDGMYVPMNLNFPAIDLIWKMGENIWFVQVHVADHRDVKRDLEKLLNDVEWKKGKNMFLLYLSPAQSVSESLHEDIFKLNVSSPLAAVLAMPFTHFECIQSLQWPNRDDSLEPAIRSAKP